MEKVIIHPLTQLIIRENPLMGYEGEMNMDKLDKELRFKTTKFRKDGATHEEILEMAKGEWGIPDKGWVTLYISKEMTMEDIWKEGMKKV